MLMSQGLLERHTLFKRVKLKSNLDGIVPFIEKRLRKYAIAEF